MRLIDFLKKFDGSGRKPRDVQASGLKWCADAHDTPGVDAMNDPVGAGKSAKAVAIQKVTGAPIVISSNILMDQYTAEYKRINFLKGKTHYRCYSGLTCGEWTDVMEQKPCHECPYKVARESAAIGAPTFYNPMSLYYLRRHFPDFKPDTIVVDEAHQLPGMILQLTSKKFQKSLYGFKSKDTNELELMAWMSECIRKLTKLFDIYKDGGDFKKMAEISSEMETLALTKKGFEENPQNYAVFYEEGMYRKRPDTFLHIKAIRPPQFLVRTLLDCRKLYLMSGTLFTADIEDLAAGREYRYADFPSPIPKERRPILYRPTPFPMNVNTDPAKVVKAIEAILEEFPNRNTIIHTTYDRSKKFAPHFKRPVLINTPEDKGSTVERFKRLGGVFLASGCAEGLDLRDDLCRLNIIPHLIRPNLGDPVVAKRRALADGGRWLALEALKTCIQQYGRSTRHERDQSITVVMDPTFSRTVQDTKDVLPKYFYEAICWNGEEP